MIFVSDYDATLFNNGTVSDDDLNRIHEFRSLGHKFGIITGRPIDSILLEIEKYDIPVDFIAGVNGGVVLNHAHEVIYKERLTDEMTRELMALLDQEAIHSYNVNDGFRVGTVYLDGIAGSRDLNVVPTDVDVIVEAGVGSFYILSHSEAEAAALAQKIDDAYRPRGVRAYVGKDTVDIGTVSTSKATAIEHLMRHYAWEEPIFTMGDSFNDLPMIGDYYGIAIDHAEDAVKARAKMSAPSVGDALFQIMKGGIIL